MMQDQLTRWFCLLAICLLLVGCGTDEPAVEADQVHKEPDAFPTSAVIIVEPSEQTLFIDGESHKSVDLVRDLLRDDSIQYPVSAVIVIDETYESETRVRFMVEIGTINGRIGEDTAKILADQTYDALKKAFDENALLSAHREIHMRKVSALLAVETFKQAQSELKGFQERVRGFPDSDALRLERRKLERRVETTLQAQIEADKLVESAQKRIDRDRHATLLRVR